MTLPSIDFEKKLWAKGCEFIAGLDEVGRGAWAGPLVVAAVILPANEKLLLELIKAGVRDSKKLSPKPRRELSKLITRSIKSMTIVSQNADTINRRGIVFATQAAMRKALKSLSPTPQHILVDGFYLRYIPKSQQTAITQGDARCLSIAAASIIAKVYRDTLMAEKYHPLFPHYGFDRHKGYGTRLHQEAIQKHGPCPLHRPSFIPAHLLNNK